MAVSEAADVGVPLLYEFWADWVCSFVGHCWLIRTLARSGTLVNNVFKDTDGRAALQRAHNRGELVFASNRFVF